MSILRLTDYMLVMGCGVTAIGMLASLATSTEGDAMAWWVGVPLATLLGYAGYTGWRHVGTIDPRVWRTYIPTCAPGQLSGWFGIIDEYQVESADGAGSVRYRIKTAKLVEH